jgi:hypothetical protein
METAGYLTGPGECQAPFIPALSKGGLLAGRAGSPLVRTPAHRRQREAERLTPGVRTRHAGGTFSPKDQADYPRERRASCAALAQGRLGSLNGILPGFAGPLPFTALALLPLAPAPPAVSGYDRERKVSFPSSRLMFPRCGVRATWAPCRAL